ncbi:periplasmic sensor diguanylate cyclase/phosphodiesterase [Roseibium hamelinense]|uniref:Periplasmic sensor diguanylate cyclase/phosphodiesterase n=1 Tax=Roseibium hamelinense TaxID=150831 RepID=A0A562TA69_9HYPH|nr:bifunctional diguanylate cyclase/phosphodiesterase [Roseibium hamelinense]MTI45126.1 bifunctional diguanylate cyclase/phosphodiesterase [Roseibium hamelinense]TWI90515.1 periplasmic sensor diguanylate cyclase/phosphodiesterase [Roseibium hamelinense]
MQLSGRSSGGNLANAIVIPMIVVVGVAVACVFGLMIWSSSVSDRAAAEGERQLLQGALELELDQMSKQQISRVVSDQAYFKASSSLVDHAWLRQNITRRLDEQHGMSRALLIGRDLQPAFSYDRALERDWITSEAVSDLAPSLENIRVRYYAAFKETPSGLFLFAPDETGHGRTFSESGLIAMENGVYLFAASAIVQEVAAVSAMRKQPVILVSFKPLATRSLAEIASISGLKGLKFVRTEEELIAQDSLTGLKLYDPRGTPIGYLAWTPSKPGSQMLHRLTPVLLLLALALIGLTLGVIDYTRQTARRITRSQEQAVYTAKHDALSGLPNREHFSQLLKAALKQPQTEKDSTAVIYIDLDHFKDINDTLGHAAGDEIIRAVASRLQGVMPPDSYVARISGDEFAMLLAHCDGQEWIEHILTRIQDQLVHPVRVHQSESYVSLSIGAAVAPRDGTEPGELLRKADIALYDAKENGRGRWSFFDPRMQEVVQTKDKMSRDLRQAIDKDELEVAYQPQYDPVENKIVAIETLARWTKPGVGAISPAVFIPIAEETGLINDLGIWILRRACRDAHRWPDLVVSVNVSPTQFRHPRFVEKLIATLEDFDLPPQRLEIEVTENVFAGRDDIILRSLQRIKDLGVKVALDDFGSGYSSLSYLRRFPFDTLKIDRDFILGMDQGNEARAILKSIIQLGNALGMTIVAEGVGTAEQITFLKDNACHRIQGFYISRPLNEEALIEFLADFDLEAHMASLNHFSGDKLAAES